MPILSLSWLGLGTGDLCGSGGLKEDNNGCFLDAAGSHEENVDVDGAMARVNCRGETAMAATP